MKVQAQISIYPLRTKNLSEPIDEFCRILKDKGLEVKVQTMNSLVTGQANVIFSAIQEAFEQIAEKYNVVMELKISNACPMDESK